jgi:hypothetical protein
VKGVKHHPQRAWNQLLVLLASVSQHGLQESQQMSQLLLP